MLKYLNPNSTSSNSSIEVRDDVLIFVVDTDISNCACTTMDGFQYKSLKTNEKGLLSNVSTKQKFSLTIPRDHVLKQWKIFYFWAYIDGALIFLILLLMFLRFIVL
jgi:hypothetical protein